MHFALSFELYDYFSIFNFQLSIFNFQSSIFNLQFSIFNDKTHFLKRVSAFLPLFVHQKQPSVWQNVR